MVKLHGSQNKYKVCESEKWLEGNNSMENARNNYNAVYTHKNYLKINRS